MELIKAIKKMTSADDLLEVVAAVRGRVKELPDIEQGIYYETDKEADKELGEEIKADEKSTAEIKEDEPTEEKAPGEEPSTLEEGQPDKGQDAPIEPQEPTAEPAPETPPAEPAPQETDLPQEPIQQEEQVEQANRRIDSLEAQIIGLKNQLEAALSEIEKKPFGLSPTAPTGGEPEADEDTRIMQSYYKGRYRK